MSDQTVPTRVIQTQNIYVVFIAIICNFLILKCMKLKNLLKFKGN